MDNRFFVERNENNFIVREGEANHLLRVRRARVGDNIVGFTGDGYDYFLTIQAINKDEVICTCIRQEINRAYKADDITVYLAMLKHDALTTAIDYLAEMNVSCVKLFKSDYSIAQLDDKKLSKLNYLALLASKQCERADIMRIELIDKRDIETDIKAYEHRFFAYEDAKESIEPFRSNSFAVIIGAEGGFSPAEVDYFSSFSDTISLGKTILRAEVACVSAVSQLKAVRQC